MGFPDFFLIGAQKAGTTSLHHYLNQHPRVFMCPVKESNFFALEGKEVSDFHGPGDQKALVESEYVTTITDRDTYVSLFEDAGDDVLCGEACPLYLYHPDAPERMQTCVPDAELFAILRNPVERAYSAYLMLKGAGRETASFRDGLRREEQRIEDHWEYAWHYKNVGLYAEQLRRYFERFDRDQIHVHLFEEFVSSPKDFTRSLFRTLGLEDIPVSTSIQRNTSGVEKSAFVSRVLAEGSWLRRLGSALIPSSLRGWIYHRVANANTEKPSMSPEVRRELVEYFRPEIEDLEDLIDRDLSGWYQLEPDEEIS